MQVPSTDINFIQWISIVSSGMVIYFLKDIHKDMKMLRERCLFKDEHAREHEKERLERLKDHADTLRQVSGQFKVCRLEHGVTK